MNPLQRIWLVTDVYPPGCGGSGWSTHSLAGALADRGYSVEVISLDPHAEGTSQRVFEGIPVVEVGVRQARRHPMRRLGARDYAHKTLKSYLSRRLAVEPDVRVVHAQHLHSGPPALAAARQYGRAAVLTLRDYWPVCLHGTSWWGGNECGGCTRANLVGCMREYWGWPGGVGQAMVPWARRRLAARRTGVETAHRVVTVSGWVREQIEKEVADARFVVVPNIVDARRARHEADQGAEIELPFRAPYLVAAGKLTPTKGFDVMLAALGRAGCRWPVVIAGSGPEQAALARQAEQLDFEVAFPGWIEHRALLRLMRSARAFLLPGAWQEPLSRLLLEAMALGAPVVAWRSGGNPQHLTHGADAWVVENADDLRAVLVDLDDDGRRNSVADNGRRLADERFSPAAVVPQMLDVYGAALAEAARRRGTDAR